VEGILDTLVDLALFLLTLGTVGLSVSWALLHGFKPRTVVLTGTLTMVFLAAAMFFLPQWGSKQDGLALISQFFDQAHFEQEWRSGMDSMSKVGVDTEKLVPFKEFFQKYIYWSTPAWEAIRCLLWGLAAYYALSHILSRVTPKVTKPIPFREWMVPEPLIFGLIGAGALKVFAVENGPLDIMGDNLLVLFVGLYTLAGVSIMSFFLVKWRLPRTLRIVGYVVVFWFTFYLIFSCLGVLDVWFDFRKLKSAPGGTVA